MRETVLITGAGGFVGSHLALGLAGLGFRPLLVDALFDEEAERVLEPFERLTGDVRNLEPQGEVHYLIHGAAITARCGLTEVEHLSHNVSSALAALELAERLKVRRTVLLSSAGVFSSAHPGPLDEKARPDATGAYAAAKRMAELAAESLRARGVLDALSVRLGNLYGPREAERPSRPRLSLVGRMVGEARQDRRILLETPSALREWTYTPDLAAAFARLLAARELPGGVVHLANPEVLTDEEVARRVAGRLEPDLGPVAIVASAGERPPVRAPLESRYSLDLPPWTPFALGLERTVEALRDRRGVSL